MLPRRAAAGVLLIICNFSAGIEQKKFMRALLVLLVSLLFAFCKPVPPASSQKFRIEIHQASMSMDATLIFSNDSIFGKGYYLGGRRDRIFMTRNPPPAETAKILNALATIEIDSLQPEPPRKSV